jgi:hypothetical protein
MFWAKSGKTFYCYVLSEEDEGYDKSSTNIVATVSSITPLRQYYAALAATKGKLTFKKLKYAKRFVEKLFETREEWMG